MAWYRSLPGFTSDADVQAKTDANTKAAAGAVKAKGIQEQKDALGKRYLGETAKEVAVREKAPEALRQAAIDSIAHTRANTGRVVAAGRGMQGGGRGLALMGQAAQDRGLQEGATNAAYTEKINEAVAQAAQARRELTQEEGKALIAETARGANAQSAASAAETDWQTAMDNVTVFTDADAAKVRNALYAKASQEMDPAVAAAIREVADRKYNEEVG